MKADEDISLCLQTSAHHHYCSLFLLFSKLLLSGVFECCNIIRIKPQRMKAEPYSVVLCNTTFQWSKFACCSSLQCLLWEYSPDLEYPLTLEAKSLTWDLLSFSYWSLLLGDYMFKFAKPADISCLLKPLFICLCVALVQRLVCC